VSQFRASTDESAGRRGSRIDSEEGGRYLGIPQNHGQPAHPSITIKPVSSESGAVHLERAPAPTQWSVAECLITST
jgi:hypothetical protein